MQECVVKRRDIYAGLLIKPFPEILTKDNRVVSWTELLTSKDVELSETYKGNYGMAYRGMLFTIDNGRANDLIFTTQVQYPIVGLVSSPLPSDKLLIDHCANLEDLLRFNKYKENLTQEDLDKIYKQFLGDKKWVRTNIARFGFVKDSPNMYHATIDQRIPIEVYYCLNAIYDNDIIVPYKDEPGFGMIKKIGGKKLKKKK